MSIEKWRTYTEEEVHEEFTDFVRLIAIFYFPVGLFFFLYFIWCKTGFVSWVDSFKTIKIHIINATMKDVMIAGIALLIFFGVMLVEIILFTIASSNLDDFKKRL